MKKVTFCFIWIGLMACSTSSFAYYSPGSLQAESRDCDADFRSGTFNAWQGFFIAVEASAASDFYSCYTITRYPKAYGSIFLEVDGDFTEYRLEVSLTGPGTSDYLYDHFPAGTGICKVFAEAAALNGGDAYALLTY